MPNGEYAGQEERLGSDPAVLLGEAVLRRAIGHGQDVAPLLLSGVNEVGLLRPSLLAVGSLPLVETCNTAMTVFELESHFNGLESAS